MKTAFLQWCIRNDYVNRSTSELSEDTYKHLYMIYNRETGGF